MIAEYIESDDEQNPVRLDAGPNNFDKFYMSIDQLDSQEYSPFITLDREEAKWLVNRLNDFIEGK